MEEIKSVNNSFLAGSILVAALIIGGSFIYGSNLKGQAGSSLANLKANQPVAGQATANNNPEIDDDVILGDPEAPVTLIEFGDYQCPYCEKLYSEVEKRLRDEYIASGKLNIVYRDFPLDQLHPYARPAAEAAQCAKDQGKYWLYHDALFERQKEIPALNFTVLAGQLGLNQSEFKKCYDSKKYAQEVQKDYDDGVAAGVSGTPGNFINGKFLPGALPYETFRSVIEEALKTAGK